MKSRGLLAFLIVVTLGYTQAPDTLWTRTYGGAEYDQGFSVQECESGGFVIAGMTGSFGAGNEDIYLIRTDANGDTLWTKTYGGTEWDYGYYIQECTAGGFVIAGETGSFTPGTSEVYLIRTDANGDTLWTKTYGREIYAYDYGNAVQECASGGYIIAGVTDPFGTASADIYVIRTDANGDTLWTKTYGGAGWDWSNAIQECAAGGFVIAGTTDSFGAGSADFYLIRTDANGDTLWTKTYGGADWDWGNSIQECSSGGFIIAGETASFGAGMFDVYLVRTDANGDTLWTKTYGGANDDDGTSIQECSSGGFVITGVTRSFGAGLFDFCLIRTDANGDTLWTKTCGGAAWDYGYSVDECVSGGFIITGWTESFGAGGRDVYLVRIGPEGGIEENSEVGFSEGLLVQPNPTSGYALIRYGLPERADVNLMLYDISGRLVKVLYAGTQDQGHHEVALEQDGLSAGVYFIRFASTNSEIRFKSTVLTILK